LPIPHVIAKEVATKLGFFFNRKKFFLSNMGTMSKTTKVVNAMDAPLRQCDFMNLNSMAMVANLELSYNLEAKERFSPIPILGFRGWTRFGGDR
jgi:hypothetical protein